jgi:hypothetical protein
MSSIDCMSVDGAASACGTDGDCRRGCREDAQCPLSTDCISGHWQGGVIASVCVEDMLMPAPPYYRGCMIETDCSPPTTCIGGPAGAACLRDCTSAELCAHGEECFAAGIGRSVCFVRCGAGGICPPDSTCRTPPGLCFPMSWPT